MQNIVCVLLKLNFPDIICVAVIFSSLKIYCIPLWRRRREHASWRDWSRAQTATSWMLNVQVKKTRGGLIEWTSKHSNWLGKFTCLIQGNIAPSHFYFLPFRQWVNYILSENLDQNKTVFGWIWIRRDGIKGPNQSCLFIYSMVVSTCIIALLFNSRQELFPEGLPEGNSFCQGLKKLFY